MGPDVQENILYYDPHIWYFYYKTAHWSHSICKLK